MDCASGGTRFAQRAHAAVAAIPRSRSNAGAYPQRLTAVNQPAVRRQRHVRCSEVAPQYLKPGGFIILDNSDWFHDASANLRNADLLEIDMAGMAPISDFVSTKSFYFHREFRGRPKSDRQPVGAIGSMPKPNFPRITGPRKAQSDLPQTASEPATTA